MGYKPQPENDEEYSSSFYLRLFNNSLWLHEYRASGEVANEHC
jgi:hypothetical protein